MEEWEGVFDDFRRDASDEKRCTSLHSAQSGRHVWPGFPNMHASDGAGSNVRPARGYMKFPSELLYRGGLDPNTPMKAGLRS